MASPSSPGLVWRQALDWPQARSLDAALAQKLHLPVSVLLTEECPQVTQPSEITRCPIWSKSSGKSLGWGGGWGEILLESRDSLSANGQGQGGTACVTDSPWVGVREEGKPFPPHGEPGWAPVEPQAWKCSWRLPASPWDGQDLSPTGGQRRHPSIPLS